MTPVSKRTQKAIEILKSGGLFCRRLERNGYTGREQFAYRLLGPTIATTDELREAGMLQMAHSTSVSTYWKLREE